MSVAARQDLDEAKAGGMDAQQTIRNEIAAIQAIAHTRPQPQLDFPPYRSSLLRHPTNALQHADPEGCELLAPVFGHSDVNPLEADLSLHEWSMGYRWDIVLTGRHATPMQSEQHNE